MKTKRTFTLEESTLAELRRIVAEAEGLPGEAVVRVRTAVEFNSDGGRARSITVVAKG